MKYVIIKKRFDNGYISDKDIGILDYGTDSDVSPLGFSHFDSLVVKDAKSLGFSEVYRLATDNLLKEK